MMRFRIGAKNEELEFAIHDVLMDSWTIEQNGDLGLGKNNLFFDFDRNGKYRVVKISFKLEDDMDICLDNLHNELTREMFKFHWEFRMSSIKGGWLSFSFIEFPINEHIECREI